MEMKKYTFIILAFALAVSCTKSQPGAQDKGMVFHASAQATKSHFDPASPSGLQLYWDDYDNMAVYSVDPADPAASVVYGMAYIQPDGIGQAKARFLSYKQESVWFQNAAAGGSKRFFAYYPSITPLDFDTVDGEPVLLMHLESSQYERDFGSYQIMFDKGASYSPGEQVTFDGFTPLTSLLKFQLKCEQSVDVKINSINVEPYLYAIENPLVGDTEPKYTQTLVVGTGINGRNILEHPDALAGIRYIPLSSILSDEAVEFKKYDFSDMVDTYDPYYHYPYDYQSVYVYNIYEGEEGYVLNNTPGDVLYASVYPTISYPSRGEYVLKISADYVVRIDKDDYGYNYTVHHEGYVHVPEPGLEAGKRYDFTLTLYQDWMNVVMTNEGLDFSYDVATW